MRNKEERLQRLQSIAISAGYVMSQLAPHFKGEDEKDCVDAAWKFAEAWMSKVEEEKDKLEKDE